MEERFKCAVCVDLIMYKKFNNKTSILLMRRKNTGYEDGEYELPGGHLESNEDLFDAMIREIKEEIVLDLEKSNLKIAHIMHHYTGNRINVIFSAVGDNLNPQIGEPDKCDEIRWFDIDDLPNNISNKMRVIINNIKNSQFYDCM